MFLNFREWFWVESTVSQLVKSDPQIQSAFNSLVLPPEFQHLSAADQLNIKKWLAYQAVKREPVNLAGLDVLLDPSDRFQVRKKLNRLDYDYAALVRDNELYHQALKNEKQKEYKGEVRPILPPLNGLQWVSLDKGYCDVYGKSMGHCGNVGRQEGDNILSLMDNKGVHYLTFIVNNKVLGEAKGRNNQKPERKFHPNIMQLLMTDEIESIKGLGYKPENNFQLSDLPPQEQNLVRSRHPNIDNYVAFINNRRGLNRRYYVEQGYYLFDRNLSNRDFVNLVDELIVTENLPTAIVSIAGEFLRRRLEVPEEIYKKILADPAAAYLYTVQYFEAGKEPKELIDAIAKDSEYAVGYAVDILKGKNIPPVLIDSITHSDSYFADFIVQLHEKGYKVPEWVWKLLKNRQIVILLLFKNHISYPDKIYDVIEPDTALYLYLHHQDDRLLLRLASGASLSYLEKVVRFRDLPVGLLVRIIKESNDANAVYRAMRSLLQTDNKEDMQGLMDIVVDKIINDKSVVMDAIPTYLHRIRKMGWNIVLPEKLYRAVAESPDVSEFVLQMLMYDYNAKELPNFVLDRLDKSDIEYIVNALKGKNLGKYSLAKLDYLKSKL